MEERTPLQSAVSKRTVMREMLFCRLRRSTSAMCPARVEPWVRLQPCPDQATASLARTADPGWRRVMSRGARSSVCRGLSAVGLPADFGWAGTDETYAPEGVVDGMLEELDCATRGRQVTREARPARQARVPGDVMFGDLMGFSTGGGTE